MISNTFVPYQERRPATDPSVPPSPPASPPSHPSRNVTGSLPIDHGMQKAKYPLNHCQPRQVFAAAARAQQQTEMSKNRHSSPSWRLENPNAGQAVQQQLQRDVHKAFSIEQQREALKWVTAAKRLGNILDLANSPMSVLPRLRPRDATAPRIHVPPLGSRRIICPSGHQYLQSTGYIRSVPVFRPTLDIRRIVPDRANDRDEGYLHAYRVSRSDERTRQAAIERAAWDVNMLEWREGIRSLPAEDHKGEGCRSEPMDVDRQGRLSDEPLFGEEAGQEGDFSPCSSTKPPGHLKRKANDRVSPSTQITHPCKRSRSGDR